MVKTKSEAEQLAFFDEVHALFAAATAARGLVTQDFRIAGTVVRTELAGTAMVPFFLRALQHLRIADVAEPDVTIRLWDSQSTGITMAKPPWTWDAVSDRGDLWGFLSRRIKTVFHYHDHSLNLFDHERRVGLVWVQTTDALPYWTVASPMRTIIHWWMERQGCQLLHGAALAQDGAALLLVGKGGVGKSSTALTGLEQGLGFLGDDYVIVRPARAEGEVPMVYSLYATAKLNKADVGRFPGYREHLYRAVDAGPGAADEKAVVMLYPAFAERLCLAMPLVAMAMPKVVDSEDTRFVAESPAVLQQAATLTSMAQLPYAGDASHRVIARLCASLDGYRIELGRDKAKVAQAIGDFLREPALRPATTRSGGGASRPLLSVIIPTYNGARFIADAVNSILAQGYPALEIIIVDDGSTDGTEAIVRALPIEVHYFKQENLGPAWARNRGIRDASGDYLAFLDVDDLFAEGALVTLMDELLADPELDVAQGYSQVTEYVPESDSFEYRGSPTESFPYSIASCVYRRRVFDKVGLFETSLHFGEDRDWFRRLAEAGGAPKRIDAVSLIVRRHGGNMTLGKSLVELNTLRVFKLALDRKRRREKGDKGEPGEKA